MYLCTQMYRLVIVCCVYSGLFLIVIPTYHVTAYEIIIMNWSHLNTEHVKYSQPSQATTHIVRTASIIGTTEMIKQCAKYEYITSSLIQNN